MRRRAGRSFGSDVLAWVWELDINPLDSRALIHTSHIGDEHGREVRHLTAVAAGKLRVDAVHVELAVADVVEPRPRHDRVPVFHALGDGEVELVDAVDAVGFGVRAVVGAGVSASGTLVRAVEVQHAVCRAAALDAVDHEPVLGVLDFGRVGLVGDADLAGAAAVDGRVGAVARVEGEELRGACCHLFAARGWERDAVAREVAAGGVEGIFWCGAGDWLGGGDEEMGVRCQSEAERCQSCGCGEHAGCSERVYAKRC